jgi:hypothetical protein
MNNADLKNLISHENDLTNQHKVKSFTVKVVIEQMKSFYLSNFVDLLWNKSYSISIYSVFCPNS